MHGVRIAPGLLPCFTLLLYGLQSLRELTFDPALAALLAADAPGQGPAAGAPAAAMQRIVAVEVGCEDV